MSLVFPLITRSVLQLLCRIDVSGLLSDQQQPDFSEEMKGN